MNSYLKKFGVKVSILMLCLFGILMVTGAANASNVTLNYEGRIRSNGSNYTGIGYFKFALLDSSRSVTYWSNDETSVGASQPTSSIITDVTDGIFNVMVGDTTIAGMAPLNPSIFNQSNNIFLRVWFSDDGVSFVALSPDKKLSNLDILGMKTSGESIFYVDPVNGNDDYTGLQASTPKKTIQSVWNILPDLVEDSITINLADGVYEEEVLMSNKTVIGGASISVVGNISTPSAVMVSGADIASSTTPVRENGFYITGQKGLYISGIQFVYCEYAGIKAEEFSSVTVNDCEFFYNHFGIDTSESNFDIYRCEVADGIEYSPAIVCGFRFRDHSRANLSECYTHDLDSGFVTGDLSQMFVSHCTANNCYRGFVASKLSTVYFCHNTLERTNTASNSYIGVVANYNSYMAEADNGVDFINNTMNKVVSSGAVEYSH